MVRFVLIVSVLLSEMVAPDRLGANVTTAPLAALVRADRSAGAAVGGVGDHLRRGCGPAGQNQHEQGQHENGRHECGRRRAHNKFDQMISHLTFPIWFNAHERRPWFS